MLNSVSMEKLRRVGLILLGLILGGGLLFIVIDLFKPKVAGLFVETNPSAKVLVDGVQMGMTPYRTTTKPGEVIILLIPESFNVSLATYETKVTLIPGVETVIRREFRELDDISADGYLDSVVRVKTHRGYKLTAFVKLGKTSMNPQESSPTTIPTPEPTSSYERKVEILQTDTGFLRVRENPSTLGKEIRQVRPGESYSLLDIDGKTGWFKIELEDGTVGWISNQYAREIESVSPTPTPAP